MDIYGLSFPCHLRDFLTLLPTHIPHLCHSALCLYIASLSLCIHALCPASGQFPSTFLLVTCRAPPTPQHYHIHRHTITIVYTHTHTHTQTHTYKIGNVHTA